jgi:hypothetical protein
MGSGLMNIRRIRRPSDASNHIMMFGPLLYQHACAEFFVPFRTSVYLYSPVQCNSKVSNMSSGNRRRETCFRYFPSGENLTLLGLA